MDYQLLSILPPLISITLALVTKKVIPALLAGALSGALILTSGNPLTAVWYTITTMWEKVTDSWNLSILVFLILLGILIHLVTLAGGSVKYGEWAQKRIRSRHGAQFATFILGILIFIDDYFNTLTVGTVMRPITDKYNISREKLAYIIDATAAPVCIIAPVSSWVVAVMATMGSKFRAEGIVLDPFVAFLQLIPYNIYALLTLGMVAILCFVDLGFGPMATSEKKALASDNTQMEAEIAATREAQGSSQATIWDLIVPVGSLIIFTILAMIYTGGYLEGGMTILDAIINTDASLALLLGGIGAVILSLVIFLPRKVVTVSQLPQAVRGGVKSMLSAIIILIFAWTIGGVISDLNTGEFLAHSLGNTLPPFSYPALLFALAGIIAFSTGTSWGTFAIMIPIAIDFALVINQEYTLIMIAAVLSGAIFGDHCSPISDTTILSSTGADCDHIEHVKTQLPYALLVAGASFIGYLVAGAFITGIGLSTISGGLLGLLIATILMLGALKIAHLKTSAV